MFDLKARLEEIASDLERGVSDIDASAEDLRSLISQISKVEPVDVSASIPRYVLDCRSGTPEDRAMRADSCGAWVQYEDHRAWLDSTAVARDTALGKLDGILNPQNARLVSFENGQFTFAAPIVRLMTEYLAQMLEAAEATNYTETSVHHNRLGELTLSLQRKNGKTPHQLRQAAEADVADLKLLQAATLEHLQNAMGSIDTPIARRKLGMDVDQPEWLIEARKFLKPLPRFQVNVRAKVRATALDREAPATIQEWEIYDIDETGFDEKTGIQTVLLSCDQLVTVEATDAMEAVERAKDDASIIVLNGWRIDDIKLWIDEGIDITGPLPAAS